MNAILRYKGYTGNVSWSDKHRRLYGRVLGMPRDLITYEGSDFDYLIKDFKGAVRDYLLLCEEKGIKPRKPEPLFSL